MTALTKWSGSITATLAAGTGYVVGSPSSATVAVNDNDGDDEPTVSISAAAATVTEGNPATFTVTASTAPASALTVMVSVTQSGMFIMGTAPPSLTVGTSGSATLMVATENDDTAEMNGSIEVTVTGGPGYTVGMAPGNRATVTVEDNDDDAGVTVTPTSLTTTEAPGASRTATFTVVLNTPPTANVVIGVSSSDISEGTVSPMSLTFTPGMTGVTGDWNRAQTVTVTGVDDMAPDDDQTYTITLTVRSADLNYNGITPVTVSVTNEDDEEPSQEEQDAALEDTLTTTLAGTGRLTVVAAVDVLSARFQQRVAGNGRRQSLTLAGQAVELDDLRAAGERQVAVALRDWGSVTLEDLMSDSAFELALSGDSAGGGDGFVLWGQGDWLDFNSKPQDTFSMDGNVLSGHIGVDYQRGGLLLGLALGHSSGEVDYVDSVGGSRSRGTVDSELLSVYPYIHYSPDGAGVEAAWAMVGFGVGEAEVQREGQANPLKTDIEMRMFGWGLRTGVYAEGGVDLALKVDGFYAQTESDAVGSLPSVDSDAVRGRLAVELGHHLEQAGGALDTSLEVAARADAGDAEEGVGGEVGIGLGYTSLLGLDIEVRGRYLVAHSEEDFDEWGASVMVRYDLTRAGGQGFSFELAPGWGDASSRADTLWGDTHALDVGQQAARSLGRLDLQMGYGLRARAGLLTPFSELSLAGQALRRARLGVRLDLPGADTPVRLELSGEHAASGSRCSRPAH